MKVYRDTIDENGVLTTSEVFDIMECTYTGKDMGERKITATIKWPTVIDFQLGDYVEMQMQNLIKSNGGLDGGTLFERFYIYSMPSVKKNARPMSAGDAFETTVTFYPRQYELAAIQMRDCLQMNANNDKIIFTGNDEVTFYGGAYELLLRIQAVLDEAMGAGVWKFEIADLINEQKNNAVERFAFSFSGNSVMDALLKICDPEGINSTFFINERTIYVGFKRPYLCSVNDHGAVTPNPLNLTYGKTSHLPIDIDHGGLFSITKTLGNEMPITKLYARGAARNLNRYYCSDRIRSGRYVKNLMLPQFDIDGRTDWVLSDDEHIKRYGIREGSKVFEEIYPSLRYMTYGDIRQVKYVLKVHGSGLETIKDDKGNITYLKHSADYAYPVARVQCYKVVEDANKPGYNKLVESWPDTPIAVSVHATGKVIRTVLYTSLADQKAHDRYVPHTDSYDSTDDTKAIPGSCFLVHDPGFGDDRTVELTKRKDWFEKPTWQFDNPDKNWTEDQENEHEREREIELHQIEYVDTFWFTDLYKINLGEIDPETGKYNQKFFPRDGYSAYCWARTNEKSNIPDETLVNEIVAVQPVEIDDTSLNLHDKTYQQLFDVYLRDVGFGFDEQNDFGDMVFVFDDVKISFLDGLLTGQEYSFIVPNEANVNAICAYYEDGTRNEDFYKYAHDYDGHTHRSKFAEDAVTAGAFWRVTCAREYKDNEIGLILPNRDINAKQGDHVVFLDLYMPDVYIHAAENRLLVAAQKYLDANDDGKLNYSVEFDKVRIQQVKNYAIQMREGLRIRMKDDDLAITTEDYAKTIYENKNGFHQAGTISVEKHYAAIDVNKKYYYPYVLWNSRDNITFRMTRDDYKNLADMSKSPIQLRYGDEVINPVVNGIQMQGVDDYLCDVTVNVTISKNMCRKEFDVYARVMTDSNEGDEQFIKIWVPLMLTAGKYYTITMDLAKYRLSHLGMGSIDNNTHPFMLVSGTGQKIVFEPGDYTMEVKEYSPRSLDYRRVTVRFKLPESIDDSMNYYIYAGYRKANHDCNGSTWLMSVLERNTESGSDTTNYIDLCVDSVNIKITDNTRLPVGHQPEPIREVQANLAETKSGSAWATIMNDVAETQIETNGLQQTYQSVVASARRHYRELLTLKDNIFDPDGTCDKTFLQVMMLQVGADSMNYLLHLTKQSVTGMMSNYNVGREEGAAFDTFEVFKDDQLDHYVYTLGSNKGTWQIPGSFSCDLKQVEDEEGNLYWPVYFVCIRCKKDNDNDLTEEAWICSTKQYPVNDPEGDSNYWYFNWGILSPDSDGHYTLTETRGNAYMYGDNLVVGKISSQAKNCWFDLTHGEFVLGDNENGAALSYKDGKLTIANTLSQTTIDGGMIMTNLIRLGDNDGVERSGLSGLDDAGKKTLDDGTEVDSNGVALWAGGTYEDALKQAMGLVTQFQDLLPVLITKNGVGSKIGCFEVVDESTVRVIRTETEYIEISVDKGIRFFKDGKEVITITTEDVIDPKGFYTSHNFVEGASVTAISGRNEIILGDFYKEVPVKGVYNVENETTEYRLFEIDIVAQKQQSRFPDGTFTDGGVFVRNKSTGDEYAIDCIFDKSPMAFDIAFVVENTTQLELKAGAYELGVWFECGGTAVGKTFVTAGASNVERLVISDIVEIYNRIMLGNNGLLVAESNKRYMLIKTNSNIGCFDMKIQGLGSSIPEEKGQVFMALGSEYLNYRPLYVKM